ncbi:MAG: hypothetical protein IJ184_03835 [Alphaproteobacteria bacterium]|nr:hypothetical protein [Alphaproteobacteria bacterium]
MPKLLTYNRLVFAILMLFSVAVSVILKNENFFDIANYHYYNPWAWLNGRVGYDIAPASYLTFLNPLLDLPRYFTIVWLNEHINWFYAVNGLWFGLLLFVFYKILQLLFNTSSSGGHLPVILTLIVAITGRMTWFNISSSNNEIILAFINLCGLYLLFREVSNKPSQKAINFMYAGLILGASLGLKSTNITICVASGLSLLIGFKWLTKPIKFISIFALSGLVGYLIINGWWMYKMYSLYGNPFFPFLNSIFKSEYFLGDEIYFDNFAPTFKQLVYCPFLALSSNICNGEGDGLDFRLQIFYTLAVVWLIYLLITKKIKYYYQTQPLQFFFYLFWVIDYLLWAKLFAVQHYFVVIEMFGAVLLIQSLQWWFKKKKFRVLLWAVVYVLSIVLLSVPLIEENFNNLQGKDAVIKAEPIKLPDHTLIKLYNMPLAGLLPEIAKYSNDFRAVGLSQFVDVLPHTNTDITQNGKFKDIINELEKQYDNQVIIFRLSLNNMQKRFISNRLKSELKGKKCRQVATYFNNLGWPIYICIPHDWEDFAQHKKDETDEADELDSQN